MMKLKKNIKKDKEKNLSQPYLTPQTFDSGHETEIRS